MAFWVIGMCILTALALTILPRPAEAAKKIAIVLSSNSKPYADAANGFKNRLSALGESVEVKTWTLASGNASAVYNSINNGRYDLVCAIGTTAATEARDRTKTPTVFLLVVDPVGHKIVKTLKHPGGHVTGVSLDIPIEDQIDSLREVAPGVRRLGMVCGPSSIEAAKAAVSYAKFRKIELIIKSVSTEKAARSAFRKLKGKVDALLALPDPMVYTSANSEAVIMFALDQRIPFMSYSTNYVKAGALMCLYCDYESIGKQGADMARTILRGRSPSSVPVESPEGIKLAINYRVARSIGLWIAPDVRRKAVSFGAR